MLITILIIKTHGRAKGILTKCKLMFPHTFDLENVFTTEWKISNSEKVVDMKINRNPFRLLDETIPFIVNFD
jgi:ribosome-associated toxin RatA of RatAB toxin-antitoxin module